MRRTLCALGLEFLALSFSGCAQPKKTSPTTLQAPGNVLAGKVLEIRPVNVTYWQKVEDQRTSMRATYQFFYVYLADDYGALRTVIYPTRPRLRAGQHVQISVQPLSHNRKPMMVSDLVELLSSGTYQSDDHTVLYGDGVAVPALH